MANGSRYNVKADAAAAVLNGGDIVALTNAEVRLVRIDGYQMQARADAARFKIADQVVEVDELLNVTDNQGMNAKLRDAVIDWTAQTLVAKDNVLVLFADGSSLTGADMIYDAGTRIWTFSSVKLTLAPEGDIE
jgi:hypothetical protein